MISTKDLMLGNWVYDGERTKFPMQVVGIGNDYVYLDFEGNEGDLWESTPEDLQGIPITQEILEKNGFCDLKIEERKIYGKKIVLSEKKTLQLSFSPKFCTCTILEVLDDSVFGKRLESIMAATYLHELQNFYRMTTKQDLMINL